MSKGLNPAWLVLLLFIAPAGAYSAGEIYKVVHPDGTVTYTDQRPGPGAQPVDLKPLSVVETEKLPEPPESDPADPARAEPTQRELRALYRDFRITQPQPEETFWGTGNAVTIAWGGSEPIGEDMRVMLYVDGEASTAPGSGSVTLTFDRGEHSVYATLRDARNRRIATTETVTFFVKQHSVNFNRARN